MEGQNMRSVTPDRIVKEKANVTEPAVQMIKSLSQERNSKIFKNSKLTSSNLSELG